ncbi:MAG: neutral zinc metallopeptidase [Thermomicrobiales bacterium]|nr:neutral zinc metallopeptidase [Thermomicrobiales bacterium]
MRILGALTLIFALLAVGLAPAMVGAQTTSDREATQSAEDAARQYLDLAIRGDYNTLFDYLHPDVLDVAPRSVALKLFEQIYAATNPGPATIEGVQLGAYTWPVNGKTYDDAAQVSYSQEFTDKNGQRQTLHTTMYLVPFQGRYRWFFGNSRAYIAEAIARYAPPPPPEQPTDIDALLKLVVNDLDGFYRISFQASGEPYQSPGVTVIDAGRGAMTGCGLAQSGFWAFYCPVDGVVYLDKPFLSDLAQRYGDFAVAYVIGHEWAHHVQTLLGIERTYTPQRVNQVYSIEMELQADCLAGVWSRDLDARDFLDLNDLAEASSFIFDTLGDPAGVGPFDPQAHGTSDERLDAFSDGYDGGFVGCQVSGLSPVR